MGRPLSPPFGIQILEPSEKIVLEAQHYAQPTIPERTSSESSSQMRLRDLEQIVNLVRVNIDRVPDRAYGWYMGEESDEGEYEDGDEYEEEDDDIE